MRGTLGELHDLQDCNASRVGMPFLHVPAVDVLLASKFSTSGMHLQRIEYAPAMSNGKPRTSVFVFTRAQFCIGVLLPPKRQLCFFQL